MRIITTSTACLQNKDPQQLPRNYFSSFGLSIYEGQTVDGIISGYATIPNCLSCTPDFLSYKSCIEKFYGRLQMAKFPFVGSS